MYRFLLTPRWLAGAALAVAAAVVMVMLGNWQLHRYHERSAINARIDAGRFEPGGAADVGAAEADRPRARAGPAPGKDTAWTKVTVTGRYDPTHEIQARGRTVEARVGFEIVTPLLLDDGTAVLVDRGWVPPAAGGAIAAPTVPPAPTGTVTVVGQVHLSESRPTPLEHRDGRIDTRRISVPQLAPALPYPVYGAYVLLTEQTRPPTRSSCRSRSTTRTPGRTAGTRSSGGSSPGWRCSRSAGRPAGRRAATSGRRTAATASTSPTGASPPRTAQHGSRHVPAPQGDGPTADRVRVRGVTSAPEPLHPDVPSDPWSVPTPPAPAHRTAHRTVPRSRTVPRPGDRRPRRCRSPVR